MFRFTIRDVLWLTVVAVLVVAWGVDRARLARLASEVSMWRHCTGALEHASRHHGYSVKWSADRSTVEVLKGEGWRGGVDLPTADYEPGIAGVELEPFPRPQAN